MTRGYQINHFFSRFMVEAWECYYRKNNGVWTYNFGAETLEHLPSNKVFARKRVFSDELEKRYNKVIETPLSQYYSSLLAGRDLHRTNREIEKALFLLFFSQSSRVQQALEPERGTSLTHILSASDETLDDLVNELAVNSRLIRCTSTHHQPMFLPRHGMFAVPYQDTSCLTGWTFGFAIPLTPYVAVLMVSKSVASDTILQLPLWACSVGLAPKMNCIIIPPFAADRMAHGRIVQEVNHARAMCDELHQATEGIRYESIQVAKSLGLSVSRVHGCLHGKMTLQL